MGVVFHAVTDQVGHLVVASVLVFPKGVENASLDRLGARPSRLGMARSRMT